MEMNGSILIRNIIHSMSELHGLFEGGSLIQTEEKFYWLEGHDQLELDPFVQSGYQEGLPYLFQGLYENKVKAKADVQKLETFFTELNDLKGSIE
jgi:hypothetical protein